MSFYPIFRGFPSYSFIAVDFHHTFLASLPAHSLALRPAHSRAHHFVTRFPKASDISSPPCLPRLLPAGAAAGRGLHPLWKSAALSRRTPIPVIAGAGPEVSARFPHWHGDGTPAAYGRTGHYIVCPNV